jgi:hypothetical protein
MNKILQRLCAILLASLLTAAASAQVDATREFRSVLFPPDLILGNAEVLGLTDQQRDAVTALVKETKQVFGEGQAKVREAADRLGQTLKAGPVSEPKAEEQFTLVLDAEREMKRAQFMMLVRAKNLLTPAQQEKLRVIVENLPPKGATKLPPTAGGAPDVRQELNARMQKVQAGVDRWRREGRDPAPLLELMKTFGEQMQAGQLPQAKETLQRALERLNAAEKS